MGATRWSYRHGCHGELLMFRVLTERKCANLFACLVEAHNAVASRLLRTGGLLFDAFAAATHQLLRGW